MDIPNIGSVSGTPGAPTGVPDLSGLNNGKAEGALNKADGTPVNRGSDKSSVTGSGDKSVTKMTANEAKDALEKISVGEGETYTKAELKVLLDKAKRADEIEKGAHKKFLESSNMKKESMRLFKLAKDDPKGFLQKTGMDPKKFAYDEVAEDVKNQMRDPREIELEKANKRLEEFEAEKASRQEKIKADRLDKESKAIEQRFHAEMIEALEAFPELPKNAHTVAELARAIDQVRQKHGVLLTAKEVAPMVAKDIRSRISGMVKGADAEKLIALIGQEGVDILLKHSLSKIKDPLKGGTAGAIGQDGQPVKEQKKYKSSHDFYKSIDRAAKEERERGGR